MGNGAPGRPSDQELASTTNATKGATAGLAAGIAVIGGAILALRDQLKDLGDVLGLGVLALVAVALISAALIVVADMRVRSEVKVAQIQTAAAPRTEGSLSQWSAIAAPMAVKISGDAARFGVLALRHDPQGRTWYLIGRQGQRPQWVENEQIEETFYEADPSQYEPPLPQVRSRENSSPTPQRPSSGRSTQRGRSTT